MQLLHDASKRNKDKTLNCKFANVREKIPVAPLQKLMKVIEKSLWQGKACMLCYYWVIACVIDLALVIDRCTMLIGKW